MSSQTVSFDSAVVRCDIFLKSQQIFCQPTQIMEQLAQLDGIQQREIDLTDLGFSSSPGKLQRYTALGVSVSDDCVVWFSWDGQHFHVGANDNDRHCQSTQERALAEAIDKIGELAEKLVATWHVKWDYNDSDYPHDPQIMNMDKWPEEASLASIRHFFIRD